MLPHSTFARSRCSCTGMLPQSTCMGKLQMHRHAATQHIFMGKLQMHRHASSLHAHVTGYEKMGIFAVNIIFQYSANRPSTALLRFSTLLHHSELWGFPYLCVKFQTPGFFSIPELGRLKRTVNIMATRTRNYQEMKRGKIRGNVRKRVITLCLLHSNRL